MNESQASAEPDRVHLQHPQTADESPPCPSSSSSSARAKPVTACERCRRRKIRCDGQTPCATCCRFRIKCVRIHRNDTQALEQRVRQLEAQIAEFNMSLPSAQSQGASAAVSSRSWPSDLRLITDLVSPGPALPMGESYGQLGAEPSFSTMMGIPHIRVVDYAGSSPSLRPMLPMHAPGIPGGALDSGHRLQSPGAGVSPPITGRGPPNDDTMMPYLSPTSVAEPARSRSSSLSSLNLDFDWSSAASRNPSVSGLTELDFATPPPPTRFEAEMLLDRFFDKTRGSTYPLERERLFGLLDVIEGSSYHPAYHPAMARFHVYMAMAVVLRMERDGRATTRQLLDNCYRLAIEETRSPLFWKHGLAVEAATLLVLFAQASIGE